jgi:hypothetical protein
MKRRARIVRPRLLLAVPLAADLLVAPVVTPVWAAPHPMSPTVHTRPIGWVDLAALAVDPPAMDPVQAHSAARGRPEPRVSPVVRPEVLTGQILTGCFTTPGVTWAGS